MIIVMEITPWHSVRAGITMFSCFAVTYHETQIFANNILRAGGNVCKLCQHCKWTYKHVFSNLFCTFCLTTYNIVAILWITLAMCAVVLTQTVYIQRLNNTLTSIFVVVSCSWWPTLCFLSNLAIWVML